MGSIADTNGKFDSNNRKSNSKTGQCIVYVEARAVEIIKSAKVGYDGISDRSKYTKIWSEAGFGCAKYALASGSKATKMKKLFKTSTDVNKPQAGAVIVWKGGGHYDCGKGKKEEAGHVAIIENVRSDGKLEISQSNWCSGGCELFSKNTISLEDVKNYGGNHPFLGYIYLLQPIK